ncbi:MAG: flagellar biosynthetic protein FliQ, partial [Alphaproteobacteria bacterium]|nr:flagellar biosynthetic protein FliQ [Alphaproteobacteria bacterium]
MTPEILVDIARDSIITLLVIAGPLMAISMIVGLIISILQALTQIQEMTLTFVPKMVIMFAS